MFATLVSTPILILGLISCACLWLFFLNSMLPLWFERSQFGLYLFNATAILLTWVWWSIGSFRTCNNLLSKSQLFRPAFLFVTTMLFVFQTAGGLTSWWLETYKNYSSIELNKEADAKEFANSYRSKAWSVMAVPEISRIVATGSIGVGSAAQLEAIAKANPNLRLLELDSPGGLVAEQHKLMAVVRKFQFDTVVLGRCYSACTGIYLQGDRRYIGVNASFGFHQSGYRGRPQDTEWSTTEYMTAIDYFEKEISRDFANTAINTSYYDLWRPDPFEVKRAGYATAWWSERGREYR